MPPPPPGVALLFPKNADTNDIYNLAQPVAATAETATSGSEACNRCRDYTLMGYLRAGVMKAGTAQ